MTTKPANLFQNSTQLPRTKIVFLCEDLWLWNISNFRNDGLESAIINVLLDQVYRSTTKNRSNGERENSKPKASNSLRTTVVEL